MLSATNKDVVLSALLNTFLPNLPSNFVQIQVLQGLKDWKEYWEFTVKEPAVFKHCPQTFFLLDCSLGKYEFKQI